MKRLLFAALFSLISYTSMAVAAITIKNNTPCSVTVQLFDYDPGSCTILTAFPAYTTVTIGAFSSTWIAVSAPTPPVPYRVGIEVNFTSCSTPTVLSSWGTGCYPNPATVPIWGNCKADVIWTSPIDVLIN